MSAFNFPAPPVENATEITNDATGITYRYNLVTDSWIVVGNDTTNNYYTKPEVENLIQGLDDSLSETIEGLDDSVSQSISDIHTTIETEVDNRTNLINAAASKNNDQDASIQELSGRIDAIGSVVGVLEFKGRYQYVLEKTIEACTEAYGACLLQANGDVPAMSECNRLRDVCEDAVGEPYPTGTFTTKGTTNVMSEVEQFVFTGSDLDGQVIDWINLVEPTDCIEFIETVHNDTALYEVIEEPKVFSEERSVRVKFLKSLGGGDGNFNLQQEYEVRVIKASTGINVIEGDKRYQLKPYSVIFSDSSPTTGQAPDGVLRNGELWFDTADLELFVWNNNSWVTASKPPSQDVMVQGLHAQVDELASKAAAAEFDINALVMDRVRSPHLYYSDDTPVGNAEGNLIDGDIWLDSNDLELKFYSQGAWINPDRTSTTNDYVHKVGDDMTGPLHIKSDTIDANPAFLVEADEPGHSNSDIVQVKNNEGTLLFYVSNGGTISSGSGSQYKPYADQHLATKKYVDDQDLIFKPARYGWKVSKNSGNKPMQGYVSCSKGRIESSAIFRFSLRSMTGGLNMLKYSPSGDATAKEIYKYHGSSGAMTAMVLTSWVYQSGGTQMWKGSGEVREILLKEDYLQVTLNSHTNNNGADFDSSSIYHFTIGGFF